MDKMTMNSCCKGQKCPELPSISEKNDRLRMDLEETFNEMGKRQCNLAQRRQCLAQQVVTLEKVLPLIAYKNWSLSQKHNKKSPFGKIKNFLDQLSPYPYPSPTEKLLEKTKLELQKLDEEIEVLHKKILEIEVKLEESEMELESLESVNNELDEKLKNIEKEMLARDKKSKAFPDLSSVDAEDLVCLGKLRQLVQQEVRLKNCINALESRENHLKNQLEKFISIKERESCPKSQKLKRKYCQNRRNKQKSGRSVSRKPRSGPRFPCSGATSKNLCHCGSTESLNYDSIPSNDDNDDADAGHTSSDEYRDCCDCGISIATSASSNP